MTTHRVVWETTSHLKGNMFNKYGDRGEITDRAEDDIYRVVALVFVTENCVGINRYYQRTLLWKELDKYWKLNKAFFVNFR